MNSAEYFTHINNYAEPLKFTAESVPTRTRHPKGEYTLQNITRLCTELNELTTYKKERKNEEIDVYLDGIKFENEIEGVGVFTAYNDRSIRVLFEDRTVIRIYLDLTVSAITRSGEMVKLSLENPYNFEQYIPICIEFYDWAFTSHSEKLRREEDREERERLVMAEISRNQRTGISEVPVEVETDLQSALQSNEDTIREINSILSKINRN